MQAAKSPDFNPNINSNPNLTTIPGTRHRTTQGVGGDLQIVLRLPLSCPEGSSNLQCYVPPGRRLLGGTGEGKGARKETVIYSLIFG